jgi:hypothetical protein
VEISGENNSSRGKLVRFVYIGRPTFGFVLDHVIKSGGPENGNDDLSAIIEDSMKIQSRFRTVII